MLLPNLQNSCNVEEAYIRIKNLIVHTPVVEAHDLNLLLKHNIFFKLETLQHSKAFKIRGILNHLLFLKEKNKLPQKIVGYSTGNHGIGMAVVASWLNIKARIYLPKNTNINKQKLARSYSAEIILTETRQEAEYNSKNDYLENGFYYMHPSDNDLTIAGVGTMAYEAIKQLETSSVKLDAIFGACGGGGLLAGTYLAKELLSPTTHLFGVEPETANDAYISKNQGTIYTFQDSPITIADGLRTLALSNRTFNYILKLNKIYLSDEQSTIYWTDELSRLLRVPIEPSAALNMSGVVQWLKEQSGKKNILVLISGGNI